MTHPFGEKATMSIEEFQALADTRAGKWINESRFGSRWLGIVSKLHFWDNFVQEREVRELGQTEEYEDSEHLTEVDSAYDADIVSSAIKGTGLTGDGKEFGGFFLPVPKGYNVNHKLLVDIDFPVLALESSTPGHSHLYIDKELTWDQVLKVLRVLAEVGLVEEGYVAASERRGVTHLRVPWLKKSEQKNGRYV